MKTQRKRLPPWMKVRFPGGPTYMRMKSVLRDSALHTVCEEAHCPNIGECFDSGTATFLILGDICTRNCRFCAVQGGHPDMLDPKEPERVAETVQKLKLQHAVITSVTRDDLPDGGAEAFARTIRLIRERRPQCRIEVLVPDFNGSRPALEKVLSAEPDILNHNIETVPHLYPRVRPKADYQRSLDLLDNAKQMLKSGRTKTGIMVGLGETTDEILNTLEDLRRVDCDIITIGQYLAPSPTHFQIERFYTPQEFDSLRQEGERMGFKHVEAGPLVRSSYHAHRHVEGMTEAVNSVPIDKEDQ